MYKIYKLQDPNTTIIMYIGRTTMTLEQRLVGHLHEAYHRVRHNQDKAAWIQSLLLQNKIPIITLIEETVDTSKEKYHIQKFKPELNIMFNNKSAKEIRGRKIYQYDLEGNFITGFPNSLTAANALGIEPSNLCNVLLNKRRQAGGYLWKFNKFDKINRYRKDVFMKEVHMYDKDGTFLESFPSARHINGFAYKVISKCCNGKSKTYKGYKFSFEKKERI